MVGFDARHGVAGGQQIVHERGVEQLAVVVKDKLLVKGVADALRHAALNLALQNHRVDHPPAVVHDDVALDLHLHRFGVHFDDHGVDAGRCGPALRTKVVGGLQPGFRSRFHCAAQRVGAQRQVAQLDGSVRRALDLDGAACQLQVFFVHFQGVAGMFEHLLAHGDGGGVNGVAGNHGSARGEGARTPVKLGCIARDQAHVGDIHAQLVGHDLRKGGVMALPLRADARRHTDATAGLYRYLGPLIRANAGAFHIGDDAQPDALARGAQSRLLLGHKLVIPDHFGGSLQRGQVVAAVVGERREVLVDDLVIVGELVGCNQVALAYLHTVDAQLARA